MNKSKKSLSIFIIIFFIGVLLLAYHNATHAKASQPMISLPIAPITQRDHIRGNKNAQVRIVEYSDFECPECIYFQHTIRQVLQAYGDNIQWIVRFYPLPQHANAEKEAEAAECVSKLAGNTAFWQFNDMIFSSVNITEDGTGLGLEKLPMFAKQVGVNQWSFQTCITRGMFYDLIQNNIVNAQSAGIHQLPSTVIIDKRGSMQVVVGNQPFGVYKAMIDQALSE